jgi:hypothetical protein
LVRIGKWGLHPLSAGKQECNREFVSFVNPFGKIGGVISLSVDNEVNVTEQLTVFVKNPFLKAGKLFHQLAKTFPDGAAVDHNGFLLIGMLLQMGIEDVDLDSHLFFAPRFPLYRWFGRVIKALTCGTISGVF